MANYQIWDRVSDVYTPSGDVFTPEEWIARHRWLNAPGAKMIIAGGVLNGAVAMEFTATREMYRRMGAGITDEMTDEEVLRAIEAFENTAPEQGPDVEERIAAALELQNLLAMPTVEGEVLQ